MNRHKPLVLIPAVAIAATLLFGACSSEEPAPDESASASVSAPGDATSSAGPSTEASAAPGGFATSSPTSLPAPPADGDVVGLQVDLSSATAPANQPVNVVITAPASLVSEKAFVVSPAEDGSFTVNSVPLEFDDKLKAETSLEMGTTMTFLAIVPAEAPKKDPVSFPADVELLGKSAEFTVTIS